jgi:hypothetical protein
MKRRREDERSYRFPERLYCRGAKHINQRLRDKFTEVGSVYTWWIEVPNRVIM